MSLNQLFKNFGGLDLGSFDDEFGRLFRGFGEFGPRPSAARPALNVWSDDDAVHLVAELPGVKLEDLDITLEGRALKIAGVRHEESLGEGEHVIRRERRGGEFARTIELPVDVDAERVTASAKDGVLRIDLPIAEAAKPRKIKLG